MSNEAHKNLIKEQFTKTAGAYTQWATVDAGAAKGDVSFFEPDAKDRVLDMACGPGTLALKLAPRVARVTGVDITEELLSIARGKAKDQGLTNVEFAYGDVESLQFPDASFDLVVCGSAMHHFPDPRKVFGEMLRVCRPGGRIGIIDIISPEEPERVELTHRIRALRDPSHAMAMKASEFLSMFQEAGLTGIRERKVLCPEHFSRWVRTAGIEVGEPRYGELRALFESSIEGDLTGWNVQRAGDDLTYERSYYYICAYR